MSAIPMTVFVVFSVPTNQRKDITLDKVKGKGKAVPVLNKAPRHEGVLGMERYSSTHSLTLELDGGE
jgi:hypothetical protein